MRLPPHHGASYRQGCPKAIRFRLPEQHQDAHFPSESAVNAGSLVGTQNPLSTPGLSASSAAQIHP